MLTIIDYNSGNIGSVCNALERLEQNFLVTSDPEEIKKASKIIFPGVGRAGVAMAELKKRNLVETIRNVKAPFLGICLGMQLLFEVSEEDDTQCLNIIKGTVKKFISNNKYDEIIKVPQMGWNTVSEINDDLIFKNIPINSYFYFVNSYYAPITKEVVLGVTDYGEKFASAVKKDNFYGVQFHPEKSGKIGEKLLNNFVKL
jgi:glutamine amidotransferase